MAEQSDLTVAARVGDRLDISCRVAAGEVLAVLGPNGAGKSTLAGVVAGVVRPDEAVVRVGDRVLTDTSRGVAVPTWDRRVGLLAQDPLLFPHMSVLDNVAFAVRAAGRDARAAARGLLADVGAADLAGRRPAELSGGQAQRVALARALAARPQVLLLDEPLAGLDVEAAVAVRAALRSLLAGRACPVLLISHDLPDVVALADRVLVLEGGLEAESGSTTEVLTAPRSRFGARIAGVNVVAGVAAGQNLLRTAGATWHGVAAEPLPAGVHAVAVFSPAAVAVYRHQPHGSPRNVVHGRVAALEPAGMAVRVRLAEQPGQTPGLAADVTAGAIADLSLAVGEGVWFSVKTQAVTLYRGSRDMPAGDDPDTCVTGVTR